VSGKTGVFLCNCGLSLSKAVGFERLQQQAATFEGIAFAGCLPDLCMKTGENAVAAAVKENGLDRLLFGACSVRTHGPLLRKAAERCGINPFLVEIVDLKGLAAGLPPAAVDEVVGDQLRMAAARAARSEALTPLALVPEKTFLVIGGGVAGVTAAAGTAASGIPTIIVEKGAALGGRAADLQVELPGAGFQAAEIKRQIEFLSKASNVTILLNSTVSKVSGGVGKYQVTVNGPAGARELAAGAILLATGNASLHPEGLYGLGSGDHVVTQEAFEKKLTGKLDGLRSVAFIQCAGARNEKIPYCSRACCMVALKQAIFLKRTYPQLDVHFLFRDLQVGGSGLTALIYHAPKWGVKFHRFEAAVPPVVTKGRVGVQDKLTGKAVEIAADLVVLAAPTIPGRESQALAATLGLPVDRFGFVAEPLMRARPVDHPDRGLFVAGNAHWPCNMMEAAKQGELAASRALKLLQGTVANSPAVAFVDRARCIACGLCERTCGYGAVKVVTTRDGMKAQVDYMGCKGCGTCVAGCPVFAIVNKNCTDEQIRAQIAAG
jgi:heterodisulfide reductase subunit A